MSLRKILIGGLSFAGLALASTSASAETRGYAIAQFMTATYANPGNCPQGGNGTPTDLKVRILMKDHGMTKDQALKAIEDGDKMERPGVRWAQEYTASHDVALIDVRACCAGHTGFVLADDPGHLTRAGNFAAGAQIAAKLLQSSPGASP